MKTTIFALIVLAYAIITLVCSIRSRLRRSNQIRSVGTKGESDV